MRAKHQAKTASIADNLRGNKNIVCDFNQYALRGAKTGERSESEINRDATQRAIVNAKADAMKRNAAIV